MSLSCSSAHYVVRPEPSSTDFAFRLKNPGSLGRSLRVVRVLDDDDYDNDDDDNDDDYYYDYDDDDSRGRNINSIRIATERYYILQCCCASCVTNRSLWIRICYTIILLLIEDNDIDDDDDDDDDDDEEKEEEEEKEAMRENIDLIL
ncbi:hypothetical protein M0804_003547 [Polistes exclamans]|nr:hypothetical protein M0804_003547 [Polistes exclamans]